MPSNGLDGSGSLEANLNLSGSDWRVQVQLTVPTGPIHLRQALPLVGALAEAVVDAAVRRDEDAGLRVSCKKGCGACCRQLVPISEVEARRLLDLVEGLAEPRRSEVRCRFAEAYLRLETAGLLESLERPEGVSDANVRSLGLSYFRLGIACPFLEDESCSIHADRPVACREYLVTSPAEACAQPTPQTVRMIRLPLQVSHALGRIDEGGEPGSDRRWVPLIVAPAWARAHPVVPAKRPGTDWIKRLVENLTGRDVPGPPPAPPLC